MKRLAEGGEVGLILYYVGVYLKKIDPRLVSLADEMDFVLIVMPEGDVTCEGCIITVSAGRRLQKHLYPVKCLGHGRASPGLSWKIYVLHVYNQQQIFFFHKAETSPMFT